ncbi:helix-turn-helix domain-containing protein [Muricauda sp. 2012CJ35-5]|uniref:Helix-turn-helix domain-containing protein n=1 Tax=Flagellimonas spongiicola TaxID=2942208 RepID=A0ABT0PQW1_9FLAO|nr:helix-turn-helix domain-containing protein [Allomuricauda spongiicola]MCL6273759.1 helix-turn-helix domain-containing protein [Allomuricauda spongiicola]
MILIYFHSYLESVPNRLVADYENTGPRDYWKSPIGLFKGIHLLCYTLVSFLMIRKQPISLKNPLPIIISALVLIQIIFWASLLTGYFMTESVYALLLTVTVLILGYLGFFFPKHLSKPTVIKYSSNNLSKSKAIAVFEMLEREMERKMIYLDPDLSLKSLAIYLDVNKKELSQVINQLGRKNYSEYINGYRIAYAKTILKSEKLRNMKIIGVAFESGFNNKDSFYFWFKKITGKTPMQYKKDFKG